MEDMWIYLEDILRKCPSSSTNFAHLVMSQTICQNVFSWLGSQSVIPCVTYLFTIFTYPGMLIHLSICFHQRWGPKTADLAPNMFDPVLSPWS